MVTIVPFCQSTDVEVPDEMGSVQAGTVVLLLSRFFAMYVPSGKFVPPSGVGVVGVDVVAAFKSPIYTHSSALIFPHWLPAEFFAVAVIVTAAFAANVLTLFVCEEGWV